jgi:hypothetical protein
MNAYLPIGISAYNTEDLFWDPLSVVRHRGEVVAGCGTEIPSDAESALVARSYTKKGNKNNQEGADECKSVYIDVQLVDTQPEAGIPPEQSSFRQER